MILRPLSIAVVLVAIQSRGADAFANDDFCASAAFREAFLEGQDAADFPSVGPRLAMLGDSGVPCLKIIANDGGVGLGIVECQKNPRKCTAWAILGLARIGTPTARRTLLSLLGSTQDPVALAEVMSGVTSLRMSEATPRIKKLLQHESEYVRGEAILDLGTLGDHSDFDAMVATASTVGPRQLNKAVRGLELLGDPRTVEALEKIKAKVTEPTLQAEIDRAISRISSGKRLRPDSAN